MTTILCTLYNSLYLDKGLVLYDSLCKCSENFKLYVLCMDDKCYEVLTSLKQQYLFPIRLTEVEEFNKELLDAKRNRPFSEYCWTCTSALLLFILKKFEEPICTYVDADMFFYHNPQVLIDEMESAGKSVLVIPHRFSQRTSGAAAKVGTFCVEFNTFKNNESALMILTQWYKQCLECCKAIGDGVHWGDQKYLDEWPVLYGKDVHVCCNWGAGVAPWNIEFYTDYNKNSNTVYNTNNKCRHNIVFYHFESISYLSTNRIRTGISADQETIDYNSVIFLYKEYLLKINDKRKYLDNNYEIYSLIKHHPSMSLTEKIKRVVKSSKLLRLIAKKICRLNFYYEYEISIK